MYRLNVLLVVVLCTAIAPTAESHAPMGHGCVAPTRPVDDQDDLQWNVFLEEIEGFQACVNAATERHLAAAAEHQAAARDAVDAWNTFVRDSLNAPEDFPWPPEQRP